MQTTPPQNCYRDREVDQQVGFSVGGKTNMHAAKCSSVKALIISKSDKNDIQLT